MSEGAALLSWTVAANKLYLIRTFFSSSFWKTKICFENEVILIPESKVATDKGPLPWVIEANGWGEVASVSINY